MQKKLEKEKKKKTLEQTCMKERKKTTRGTFYTSECSTSSKVKICKIHAIDSFECLEIEIK
jgi:hypothetical protein